MFNIGNREPSSDKQLIESLKEQIQYLRNEIIELKGCRLAEQSRANVAVDRLLMKESQVCPISQKFEKYEPKDGDVLAKAFAAMGSIGEDAEEIEAGEKQ